MLQHELKILNTYIIFFFIKKTIMQTLIQNQHQSHRSKTKQ